DHRAIANAAVDLVEAHLNVIAADVDEAEETIGVAAEDTEDLVVLLAEACWRGADGIPHAHVDAEPLDAHPIGVGEDLLHPLLGSIAGDSRDVKMKVPDDVGHRRAVLRP